LRSTQPADDEKPDEIAGLAELFRNAPEVEEVKPPALVSLIRMLRLVAKMRRRHATISASVGLMSGDLDILYLLQRTQDRVGPRVTDLATNLGVTPGGISKRIDRLEAARLVQRIDAEDDRRAWRIELTAEGLALVRKARKFPRANLNKVLTSKEWALLDNLLQRLSEAYEEAPRN